MIGLKSVLSIGILFFVTFSCGGNEASHKLQHHKPTSAYDGYSVNSCRTPTDRCTARSGGREYSHTYYAKNLFTGWNRREGYRTTTLVDCQHLLSTLKVCTF